MLRNTPISKVELGAYSLLILGVLGDHITTTYGLLTQRTQEKNPFALMLIEKGMWSYADALLVLLLIAVPYLLTRYTDRPEVKALLLSPLLAGLIRIGVSLWNLSLLM